MDKDNKAQEVATVTKGGVWTRPTAKPKASSRPKPTPGQLSNK
ncbi:MAG TPA: hypothetical protein VMR45_00785 [Patescibacteria group bacterium]|nr:hypothetical protein [Patescibacteria group bacterium]